MDGKDSQLIGDARPIDPRRGRKILKRVGALLSISVGGLMAFAFFATPTRVSGATRSSRLLWQNRQKEIDDVIRRDLPAEVKPQLLNSKEEQEEPSKK